MKLRRGVFTSFVLCLAVCAPSACGSQSSKGAQRRTPTSKEVVRKSKAEAAPAAPRAPYAEPALVASLEDPAVDESSGLAASRREPGLFWTHNDAGDGPFIYAFDRQGRKRGTWRVAGAQADDWEDIDAGPGPRPGQSYLYVGDIGDNEFARPNIVVYRVAEPQVTPEDARSSRFEPRVTEQAEAFALKYDDGKKYNAEAMMVHPRTGDIYVVTKEGEGPAGVYRAAAPAAGATTGTLERVGEVRAPAVFPGMITGADISPDGRRVVLCDYVAAYELSLDADGPFDNIWRQTPHTFDPGKKKQGEAVAYGPDGQSVFTTSEGRNAQLFEARRTK